MFKDNFKLNKSRTLSSYKLNDIDDKVFIIENLFENPEKVEWLANKLDYISASESFGNKRYLGERARLSVYQNDLIAEILKITGLNYSIKSFNKQNSLFTKFNVNGNHQIETRQFVPHIDNDSRFSALIYLSKEVDENYSGTKIYKHKRTGICKVPYNPNKEISEEMKKMQLNPYRKEDYLDYIKSLMYENENMSKKYSNYTGLPESNETWEIQFSSKAKYNSMIIFPAMCFHSPVIKFSTKNTNDTRNRLTQNLFLQFK